MSKRLFAAIRSFRYQQVGALLKSGVDVDVKNTKGQTGLMILCTMSDVDPSKRLQMFRYLVKRNAEPLAVDSMDKSVFHYACEAADESVLRIILRMYSSSAVNHIGKDKHGRTAMHFAVKSGKLTTVRMIHRLFKERFISLDIPDNCGVTPLIEARRLCFEEIADFLVVTGRANPQICDTKYHLNSEEWARLATKRKRDRELAELSVKREKNLIYPRGRIKMKKIPSPIAMRQAAITSMFSDDESGKLFPNGSHIDRTKLWSPSHDQAGGRVKGYTDSQTKSDVESSISLLELSSKMKERLPHVTTFVASHIAQSQKETPQRLSTMFNAYSEQLSPSFCRGAHIPLAPDEIRSKVKNKTNDQMSSLAMLLRKGKVPSKKWNLADVQKVKQGKQTSSRKLPGKSEGSMNKLAVLPGIRVEKPTDYDITS
ncbi:uncharacterized protein [Apostichopus japonicus]|uniref:uncharacterized protein n=1 Tax=Stichopus japonicus TaxID=307972 RepID=UPI003AB7D4EC